MSAKTRRCAVYTRKSSEEGLEQDFNSLDAQREACLAYIASQRGEGWRAVPARYDDGGFSGGNMERPALQRLLQDIGAGLVGTVVVYKVDRLTRSLADFAKMVELFDRHKASFVSVTQQFNTTTSMGRLTLNVLLSFAQFEREVTGERIRDKIAASKRKGMWMGGHPPLGYDILKRALVINPEEANLVRLIFKRYLEIGSVHELCTWLNANGYRSKRRVSVSGRVHGGGKFFRGQLYWALQNRVYLGEIVHKDKSYPGAHRPIIDQRTWDKVRALLVKNRSDQTSRALVKEPSLLTGLLFDDQGNRMTPSHASKYGKRYRYYINGHSSRGSADSSTTMRVPAHDLETLVVRELQRFLRDKGQVSKALNGYRGSLTQLQHISKHGAKVAHGLGNGAPRDRLLNLRKIVQRIDLDEQDVRIGIDCAGLAVALCAYESHTGTLSTVAPEKLASASFVLHATVRIKRRGREVRLIAANEDPDARQPQFDLALIKAVARAHLWREWLITGGTSIVDMAKNLGLSPRYVREVSSLIYLSPKLVEQIISGRQPSDLTLEQIASNLSINWNQ